MLCSPTANAGSKVELAYDNGVHDDQFTITTGGLGEVGMGVHFSMSDTVMLGTNETTVSGIRLYTSPNTYVWRILDWDITGDQPGSSVLATGTATANQTGWLEIDVGPVNVSREFFVGIYNSTPLGNVSLFIDSSTNLGRTRVISPGAPIQLGNNVLLRALVDLPVNLRDIMAKIDELEAKVEASQYLIEELNATVGLQLSNLTQCCEYSNGTLLELNNTLNARLDNLTQSCENVSQTVMEINNKIGEPSSTVFSDLEEILSKIDLILERLGLAVGGTILPVREFKLIMETMSENIYTTIILALFGLAVTWIARKQTT